MLTKMLLALKATLSQSPDTKQQAMVGMSEWAGSMSSRRVDSHPLLCCLSVTGTMADESDDALALRPAGVLEGVVSSLVLGVFDSMASTCR